VNEALHVSTLRLSGENSELFLTEQALCKEHGSRSGVRYLWVPMMLGLSQRRTSINGGQLSFD
jgi:hypothetical protein